MKRRSVGFTLVEILLVLGISTVVLTGAWMVFHLGDRSRGVTATARAIQTALLIEEVVSADLHRLVAYRGSVARWDPDDSSWIAFYSCDPTTTLRGRDVAIGGVRYFRQGSTPSLLQREWGGSVRSVGMSPLTSVAFHPFMTATGPLVRVSLWVGRDPGDPPGPPHVHTFLARMASQRSTAGMGYRPVAEFADQARHAPKDQRLPRP